ncbi:unnamed protein product [Peniophora sp. CBMAI 1063]|nr:unnamed protein product [Peniophora sp. CBMAI 1063]
MSDGSESDLEPIESYGLTPVTDGEHFEAWKAFWGEEIVVQERPMWKPWVDALKPPAGYAELTALARATGLKQDSTTLAFPPTTIVNTPWKSSLDRSRGLIVVNSELRRLCDRAVSLRNEKRCRDLVIEGQTGTGKTYLAYYILVQCLSSRQNVVAHLDGSVVLFCSEGVYSGKTLELNLFSLDDFNSAIGGEAWAISDVVEDGALHVPSAGVMYCIRIVSASSPSLEHYIHDKSPAVLVLDVPTVESLIMSATVRFDVKPTRPHLRRILENVHMFGRSFGTFASDNLIMRTDLADYITGLSPAHLFTLAHKASFGLHFQEVMRSGAGPDLFSLKRDIAAHEGFIPTIASRFVLSEVARLHGLAGLSGLRSMDVVQRELDGYQESGHWLREFIAHCLLSEGSVEHLARCQLEQIFPFGASKRRGALKISHICSKRTLEVTTGEFPSTLAPSSYYVIGPLVHSTFHAVVYAQPDSTSRIGRLASPHAASPEQRRKLRPRTEVSYALDQRIGRKRKPSADRRLVLFLQVTASSVHGLTDEGLDRLKRNMDADADAEYSFVFVTGKGRSLDLSMIPEVWAKRLLWYKVSVDIRDW